MKLIPITDGKTFKALTVLYDIAKVNPKGGDIATMRKRNRILKVMDAAKADGDKPQANTFQLEDADHAELVTAINEYPWGVNDPELEVIVDAVLNAKAPTEVA